MKQQSLWIACICICTACGQKPPYSESTTSSSPVAVEETVAMSLTHAQVLAWVSAKVANPHLAPPPGGLHVAAERGDAALIKTLTTLTPLGEWLRSAETFGAGHPLHSLSPAHLAAVSDNPESTLRALTEAGDNLNAKDSRGQTPLLYATAQGNVRGVKALLSQPVAGTLLAAFDQRHRFAIEIVAQARLEAATTRELVALLANEAVLAQLPPQALLYCDPRSPRFRALHAAADEDNFPAIAAMVAKGADINQKDDRGETVLRIATRTANHDLIRNLASIPELDFGARNHNGATEHEIYAMIDRLDWKTMRVLREAQRNRDTARKDAELIQRHSVDAKAFEDEAQARVERDTGDLYKASNIVAVSMRGLKLASTQKDDLLAYIDRIIAKVAPTLPKLSQRDVALIMVAGAMLDMSTLLNAMPDAIIGTGDRALAPAPAPVKFQPRRMTATATSPRRN